MSELSFLEGEFERAVGAHSEESNKVVDLHPHDRSAERERRFRGLLEALPAAIYTTDANGRITYYNEAAAEFWGHHPPLGTSEWCGSWKLFWPDGTPLAHADCPMAMALKENRPIRGVEAIAERPDGTRVPFVPYPTPLYDENGRMVGAVNMLIDISDRKHADAQHAMLVRNELVPFSASSGGRVTVNGPPVEISARHVVPLGMALHELTSNSAKYGALSALGGCVEVNWRIVTEATKQHRDFEWIESGGPAVATPARKGFGSQLLDVVLPRQVNAVTEVDYRPEGLRVRVTLPLSREQIETAPIKPPRT